MLEFSARGIGDLSPGVLARVPERLQVRQRGHGKPSLKDRLHVGPGELLAGVQPVRGEQLAQAGSLRLPHKRLRDRESHMHTRVEGSCSRESPRALGGTEPRIEVVPQDPAMAAEAVLDPRATLAAGYIKKIR